MSMPPTPDVPPVDAPVDAPVDDPAHPQPRNPATATVVAACPYLAVEGRAWRSATADRAHRCTAVGPPAVLALEKQRRLCLTEEHATCATFLAATAAHPATVAAAGSIPLEHVTRWAITRTTPVVLDRGRLPAAVSALSPFKRGGQVALGGLMAVAFVAVLGGRLTAPDDRPAGAVDASASPTASASASVARTPTPRPSITAAPSPSLSPTPQPTPVPTAAPTPITYTVKSGDTLSAIAGRHGTTVAAIVALNGITDPSRLRVGQVLQIPPPATP
jgi:LysM repeat protein